MLNPTAKFINALIFFNNIKKNLSQMDPLHDLYDIVSLPQAKSTKVKTSTKKPAKLTVKLAVHYLKKILR